MNLIENDYKQTEVNYKFYLPDNESELLMFQNASDYLMALTEIHDVCRNVWKYKEDATAAEIKLAERIAEIVIDSGVFNG